MRRNGVPGSASVGSLAVPQPGAELASRASLQTMPRGRTHPVHASVAGTCAGRAGGRGVRLPAQRRRCQRRPRRHPRGGPRRIAARSARRAHDPSPFRLPTRRPPRCSLTVRPRFVLVHLAAVAGIWLALAFGAVPLALAHGGDGKDVRVSGSCGRGASSTLRLRAKDGAIQVESRWKATVAESAGASSWCMSAASPGEGERAPDRAAPRSASDARSRIRRSRPGHRSRLRPPRRW
jgi:hypothetical protein